MLNNFWITTTNKNVQNSKTAVKPTGESFSVSRKNDATKRKIKTSRVGKRINKIIAVIKKNGKAKKVVSTKSVKRIIKNSKYFKNMIIELSG